MRAATTLLIVTLLGFPVSVQADRPDRRVVRDRLKLLWDSLASIEIRCEEYVADARGERDLSRSHRANHFCHKKENLWFCDLQVVSPAGIRTPIDQIRQDGLKRYQVLMFKDFPDEISAINISKQVSTPLDYADPKFSALWLFLPGGKPPYLYLDQGAKMTDAKGHGPSCVAIDAVHQNHRLLLILDGDHDWLPRRVESTHVDGVHVHEVTRFTRDNGRWFPAEGYFTHPMAKGPVRLDFVVTQIRINRDLDQSLFRLPVLPPGVRIFDINKQFSFQGGEQAYLNRQSRYRIKPQGKNPPRDNTVNP